MTKSYYVTNHHGQQVAGPSGNATGDFNLAKERADALRAHEVAAGRMALHFHVKALETVYVTSTLDDALKGEG